MLIINVHGGAGHVCMYANNMNTHTRTWPVLNWFNDSKLHRYFERQHACLIYFL